jgi:hypothetical protein
LFLCAGLRLAGGYASQQQETSNDNPSGIHHAHRRRAIRMRLLYVHLPNSAIVAWSPPA